MVYDRIENLGKYLSKDVMDKLAPVLEGIRPGCEERRYDVDGDNCFVKVMSYDTIADKEQCKIEAHDKYIDIQVTMEGIEGISVFERSELEVSVPYDEAKDMLKLKAPEGVYPYASLSVLPGHFAMLMPNEAHRPKENVCPDHINVKKYVIKVKL